jgi:transketolase
MRKVFVNTLTELARKDENVFLLTGDLGFSVFESFREEFPDRFFDVGVAEQNMLGIASGLALSGKTVFVYSIIPFLTMRCYEQIRLDLCYQNTDVKMVGVGTGFSYGSAGYTHYSIEDIGIMRMLPNMTIVSPADPRETKLAVESAFLRKGPVYIRLGGEKENLYSLKSKFEIGKGIVVREGEDVTIFSTGDILKEVLKASDKLLEKKISARIINMHTIKPIDEKLILKCAEETKAIFTVEEHDVVGGLGSAVSEVLAESPCRIRLKRIGVAAKITKDVGNRDYLREKHGLSSDFLSRTILQNMRL